MEILLYMPDDDASSWIDELTRTFPAAHVRVAGG